uniref:Dissatisfaction n=1 Tax=Nilaparvata lugens TaxID=108931 RepID=A0A1L2K1M8_NILLU|nr:dissatisfaction [Nilaparvata lugens]
MSIMAHRPSLLDLRANSNQSAVSTSSRPLRSPRMPITGEAPPELSPLDAFALQSRLLARQLQESSKDGNRVSRLPPLTIESPLIQQGRSEFFRSLSQESTSASADPFDLPEPRLGMRTEVKEAFAPNDRPQSMHPTMSRIPPTPDETVPVPPFPHHGWDLSRGRQLDPVHEHTNYFGARRERSPSPLHRDSKPQLDRLSDNSTSRKAKSQLQPASRPNLSSSSSPDKPRSAPFDEPGLAPPQSLLFPKRSPSLASSSPVPVDEESSPSFSTSFYSLPSRKLSSASMAMGSVAPSPAAGSFQRSPSVVSDSSALPRPSLNFSRPLSRADTPGLEIPTRQASSDSQPSFVLADDSAHTPVSLHSEAFLDNQPDDIRGVATSYIYSTFTLPRGKALQRSEALDSQPQVPSRCEQPSLSPGRAHQLPLAAPSSPTRPSSSSGNIILDDSLSLVSGITRSSMDVSTRSTERGRFGASGGTVLVTDKSPVETCRLSEDVPRGRSPASPVHDNAMARGRTPMSTRTSDSASTVRPPQTARSLAPSAFEMSVKEHLAKGIECHENGSLNESTYHLRHAARHNNPTAMLMYALACRHGWGMRANQKEGVAWLRKAAEYASIEIADDEDRAKEGKKPANFLESRTRKAQFALSIYELGVSHMNGWGIEQDRSLALRCFEIAGNWGDVDALTEAGFCYAKGIGCKKDLKKSAKFYRMAEAKGMSMVGNSWIHKTKYNDDGNEASPKKKSKKKARKGPALEGSVHHLRERPLLLAAILTFPSASSGPCHDTLNHAERRGKTKNSWVYESVNETINYHLLTDGEVASNKIKLLRHLGAPTTVGYYKPTLVLKCARDIKDLCPSCRPRVAPRAHLHNDQSHSSL